VFASQLPRRSETVASDDTRRDAAFWTRVATSYAALGSELRDVPLDAARLFRGRDTHGLRTALVFYRSAVGVLRRWGVWDPRLGGLAAPDCRSVA
jgi:hypothetical protein